MFTSRLSAPVASTGLPSSPMEVSLSAPAVSFGDEGVKTEEIGVLGEGIDVAGVQGVTGGGVTRASAAGAAVRAGADGRPPVLSTHTCKKHFTGAGERGESRAGREKGRALTNQVN